MLPVLSDDQVIIIVAAAIMLVAILAFRLLRSLRRQRDQAHRTRLDRLRGRGA